MELRSYILLFSLLIFVLAAVGVTIFYSTQFVLSFWLTLALIIAYPCTIAIFFPLLTGNSKLSRKKLLLLTFSVTIISIAVSSSIWTIITPKWSFSVTTNKTAYSLEENVEITVSLKNMGFITHAFKSRINNPIVVSIEYQHTENPTSRIQVWFNPFQEDITEFSVGPNLSLNRQFIWNQTKSTNLWIGEEIEPGIYWIQAFIPEYSSSMPIGVDNIFSAWTSINITSP